MDSGTSCIVLRMSDRLCSPLRSLAAMVVPGAGDVGDSGRAAGGATNLSPAAMYEVKNS